jgi:cell wall-associated NlpC family hydrolase
MYQPRPGDYGVVKTNGFFGWLIRLGTFSRWNHCFIYIDKDFIIGADPTGVKMSPLSNYKNVAWNQHEVLTEDQRKTIVDAAIKAVGVPYGFFTILLLTFRILGLKVLSNLSIVKKLAEKDGFICSELVEDCYAKAGVTLINKPDYLVVPGDLAERLMYQ